MTARVFIQGVLCARLSHCVAAAAGSALLLAQIGCSAAPDWEREAASSSRAAAQVLGEHIRGVLPSTAGSMVLVHRRYNESEAADWMKGLESGLGSGISVKAWGPTQWPDELRMRIEGAAPLVAAIEQFPDAAAVVTTIGIGSYEAPSFPDPHPPLFALEWDYLPNSAFLIARGDIEAGVFARAVVKPASGPERPTSARDRFDARYLLVTPENLKEQLLVFRRAEQETY